jgi:hypothetical protein
MGEPITEIHFPKLNHFWMDAGLLGLYRIAQKEQSKESGVEIALDDSGVSFKGAEKNVQSFLQKTYDRLLKDYYNTSSQTQIEKNEGFYYNTKKDQFIRFPKVKSMGIAGLIFNKAPRPMKDEIKYDKSQPQKGILPEDFQHLQDRLNSFLSEYKLKIGSSSLLVDGPNAIRPKVDIQVKSGKTKRSSRTKGACFICGEPTYSLNEIGGTVFPMITGSSGVRSFNSEGGDPENVCWKCDYIGKFVPVTGYYIMNNDTYHLYFPYSSSLEKMNEVFHSLETSKIDDPNYLRNFYNRLGGYFQKPYEQFFTFLYSLYRIVMIKKISSSSDAEEYELDYEKLFEVNLNKSPLDFFVVYTESLGDTQMGKMIWPFQESVYLFRLLDYLERNKIDLKRMMTLLIDFDQPKNESKTILRNRVCENILKKQSVVDLIEQHVFRINKSKTQNIKPLYDFVILYEKAIREGGSTMDQETIDVAVSVGKTIGMSIAPSGKKGKGDLFRLRKSRKPEDFLNEINRIQMKYGTRVSAELYNKGQKMEENFTEFKQFCMIAALNTYNAGNPVPVETGSKSKAEAA